MVPSPSPVLFDAWACALLAVYPALCTNRRQPFAYCLGAVRLQFFHASLGLSRILGIPQSTWQRLNLPQVSCPQSDTTLSTHHTTVIRNTFLQPNDRIHESTHDTAPCHIAHQPFSTRHCGTIDISWVWLAREKERKGESERSGGMVDMA